MATQLEIQKVGTVEELYRRRNEPTGDRIVDAVIYAIQHSKTQEVADIAALMNQDPRKLTYAVEILVGVNLSEMLKTWRMLQAVDYLDDESLSLEKVAELCGFRSARSMATAFFRVYGTSPSVYRTGKYPINGRYVSNRSAEARRKVLDKAKIIKGRE